MKSLKDHKDFAGKTVFVRADFNVPIVDGVVSDDFRIKKALETIDFLRASGAKIILASHIEGGDKTLRPVFKYLKTKYKIDFIDDYFPAVPDFSSSDVFLLENLRKYPEEISNDEAFSKHIASFADCYVNEAFSVSHREHASVVGIPKILPSYAGMSLEGEIRELSYAFNSDHPFFFVLGGAKFDTKLPLVRKFFKLADSVFIGGALANDFFRAQGLNTGNSLLSEKDLNFNEFLNEKLILPVDVVVENNGRREIKKIEDIALGDVISDVGPQSMELVRDQIAKAQFVLWNGPLGNYERGFKESTLSLAKILADSDATSIVGGGDTIASIAELGLENKFSFVSTGGGAMLEFLANETLPGIDALN